MSRRVRVFVTTSVHDRCGVAVYTRQVYNVAHYNERDFAVTLLKSTFLNFLKLPFLRPDIIHIQHEFAMFDRFLSVTQFLYYPYLKLMSVLVGYKVVTTLHSIWDIKNISETLKHFERFAFLFPFLKMYLYFAFFLVTTMSDKVIVLTQRGRDTLLNLFGRRQSFCKKTFFIPHGVYPVTDMAISKAELKDRYGIQDDDVVFTIIGFAYRNKGYHLAIEALDKLVNEEKINNIRLFVISGEGPTGAGQCKSYLDELKALARQYHLESSVFFTGYLPDNDRLLNCILTNTDCFVFPYFERDCASGALSSILGFEKPIIASDIKAFHEYGVLIKFRKGDAMELARIMKAIAEKSNIWSNNIGLIHEYVASCGMKSVLDKHLAILRAE